MTELTRIKIWDLPVRLVHWSIVVLLGVAWWSGEQHRLDIHRMAGYSILSLVLFRILWGFFGSTPARFGHFLAGPSRVSRYLRQELFCRSSPSVAGHNPLGGWSVAILLGTLLLQISLGLIAVDVDGLESGPFSHLVSFDSGRMAAQIHGWVFDGLLVLTAIHIGAIGFYHLYKRQNLVAGMIHGHKRLPGISFVNNQFQKPLRAIALFSMSSAAVFLLVQFLGR